MANRFVSINKFHGICDHTIVSTPVTVNTTTGIHPINMLVTLVIVINIEPWIDDASPMTNFIKI